MKIFKKTVLQSENEHCVIYLGIQWSLTVNALKRVIWNRTDDSPEVEKESWEVRQQQIGSILYPD